MLRHMTMALLLALSLMVVLVLGVAATSPAAAASPRPPMLQGAVDPSNGSVLLAGSVAPPSALRPGEFETLQ